MIHSISSKLIFVYKKASPKRRSPKNMPLLACITYNITQFDPPLMHSNQNRVIIDKYILYYLIPTILFCLGIIRSFKEKGQD